MKQVLSILLIVLFGLSAFAQQRPAPVAELEKMTQKKPKGQRINLNQFGNPYVNATLVSPKKLTQIFNKLAAHTEIPFALADDGCYARAHKMALLLENEGIISVKVFTRGSLSVDSADHPRGKILWSYHVAPAVLTKIKDPTTKKDKYEVMVLDPSLFKRPATTKEWVDKQTANPAYPPQLTIRSRFTYYIDMGADGPTTWSHEDLEDTQIRLYKFLRLSNDKEALANFRLLVSIYQFGELYPTEDPVFEILFIKDPQEFRAAASEFYLSLRGYAR